MNIATIYRVLDIKREKHEYKDDLLQNCIYFNEMKNVLID